MLIEARQENPLREEIALFGEMLGDTIREIAGDESLQIVEEPGRLAWDANLTDDSDALARIGSLISEEFVRTRTAILTITENDELLDGTPWLKESVRVRNR